MRAIDFSRGSQRFCLSMLMKRRQTHGQRTMAMWQQTIARPIRTWPMGESRGVNDQGMKSKTGMMIKRVKTSMNRLKRRVSVGWPMFWSRWRSESYQMFWTPERRVSILGSNPIRNRLSKIRGPLGPRMRRLEVST